MVVTMMLRGLMLAACLVGPAAADSLSAFLGRWGGEGSLTLDAEPEQRFRCRLRFRDMPDGAVFFNGRCATAQASQSFAYMLFLGADGQVRAENRTENRTETNPDDPGALPEQMQGRLQGANLHFAAEPDTAFDLSIEDGLLRFTLQATGPQGHAIGVAELVPVE